MLINNLVVRYRALQLVSSSFYGIVLNTINDKHLTIRAATTYNVKPRQDIRNSQIGIKLAYWHNINMVKELLDDRLIHIEAQESVESVFEKIRKNKADSLVLVIPKQAISFRSLVGLKALKEKVDELKKQIYIITPDVVGQSFAERAGFEIIGKEDNPDDIFTIGENVKKTKEKKVTMADIKSEDARKHTKIKHGLHPESEAIMETAEKYYEEEESEELDELTKEKEMAFARVYNFINRKKNKETIIEIENENGFFSKIKSSSTNLFSWLRLGNWYLLAVIGIIAAALILAFVILPSADITLYLRKDIVKFDVQAGVSKTAVNIDYSALDLPGQVIEVEDNISEDFFATKEIEVNDRAKGFITVYNEYSSSNQGLVATTRFEAADGKIFRTAKSVIVPGAIIEEGKMRAGTIDVEVFADEPGDNYNIMPTKFTIPGFKGTPKFTAFYGASKDPMKGGRIGKAKVISSDDISAAAKKLKDDLKNKISESLKQKVPNNFILIDNSANLEINEPAFDAVVNDRVDNFKGSVSAKATAMLFKEEDFNKLIDKAIEMKISDNQMIYEDNKKISYKPGILNLKTGKLPIDINIELGLVKKFDMNQLKESLLKRNQEGLKQFFSLYPEIERAEVDFWPFWVKKVPRNVNKVDILIKAKD